MPERGLCPRARLGVAVGQAVDELGARDLQLRQVERMEADEVDGSGQLELDQVEVAQRIDLEQAGRREGDVVEHRLHVDRFPGAGGVVRVHGRAVVLLDRREARVAPALGKRERGVRVDRRAVDVIPERHVFRRHGPDGEVLGAAGHAQSAAHAT